MGFRHRRRVRRGGAGRRRRRAGGAPAPPPATAGGPPPRRVLAREHNDISSVLRRLNATILAEGDAARFVTLLYGELFPTRSGVAVTFAAAGHPLPTLVSNDGGTRSVGRPQQLLGVFRDPRYQTETLLLRPGEHLVATSNGVTDRRNGHRTLGECGQLGVLRQTPTLPASAVASRLRQAVLDFGTDP